MKFSTITPKAVVLAATVLFAYASTGLTSINAQNMTEANNMTSSAIIAGLNAPTSPTSDTSGSSATTTIQQSIAPITANNTDRELNIPVGKNITMEDISEFANIFDDQPFEGGQVSPRIAKWVNEDVFIFIQFDKPSPSNATALNYIGIGKRGIFCESDRPSPDFVHFHKWNATSYREGHGHVAGDEGYWLMWVATDNIDIQERQVSPGVDRDFSPTSPPKC